MDEIVRRIQEKLLQRGNAERQRAEEWQRSLKPTVYLGKNLFQELGGEPLEGRYLGQVGLVPGQSVPNIGRNPNKPVIPGLPAEPVPAPEEGGVIKKEERVYSAIFTQNVPSGRTQWTKLEMMHRDPALFDVSAWDFDNSVRDGINLISDDKVFYYWNGTTIQELFTHVSAVKVGSGSVSYTPDTIVYTDDSPEKAITAAGRLVELFRFESPPLQRESGCARIDQRINKYDYFSYVVVVDQEIDEFSNPFNPPLRFTRWQKLGVVWDSANLDSSGAFNVTITGDTYYYGLLQSSSIPVSDFLTFTALMKAESGTVNWEIYRLNHYSGYFTTTSEGTVFAYFLNGQNGDGQERIKYFYGAGKSPTSLSLLSLNQSQSELYWLLDPEVAAFSPYDWRSGYITSSTLIPFASIEFFNGIKTQPSIQLEFYPESEVKGILYLISSPPAGESIYNIFSVDGEGQDSDEASKINVLSFNPLTVDLSRETDTVLTDVRFPHINLDTIGIESIDYFLEDICVPDSVGQVSGITFFVPMLAIYPYTKKIFF